MAACLEYQSVYYDRTAYHSTVRATLFACFCMLGALLFRVWVKVESTDLGYEIARARKLAISYDMEIRDLRLQKSVLLRADHLSAVARRDLSLRELRPDQARVIEAKLTHRK